MKLTALIVRAGVTWFTASAAPAQESSHLSADYLREASPLIRWPRGLEPRNVDVFVHNECWIKASPGVVWANLIDAMARPSWYSNSADVHLDGNAERLAKGVSFHWRTFGFTITSTVDVFEPNREIGWSVESPTFRAHHAWLLIPERGVHGWSRKNHKRAWTPLNSAASSPMRCMTATTGGSQHSRRARRA